MSSQDIFFTEDDCTVVLDSDPIKLVGFNEPHAVVGIEAGTYDHFVFRKIRNGTIIVPLGVVRFLNQDRDSNNLRDIQDVTIWGNNVPGIHYGLELGGGIHLIDIDPDEQSGNVTCERVRTDPQNIFSAFKITPRKALDGLIKGVYLYDNLVYGGRSAFYLGSPNWVSDDDHDGLVDDIIAKRNRFYNTGDAIQAKGCVHAHIESNYCEDQRLTSPSSQSAIAIMAGPGGGFVLRNQIVRPRGDGIHIARHVKGFVETAFNQIIQAGFVGEGDTPNPNYRDAIHARNKKGSVHHNFAWQPDRHGINLSRHCTEYSGHDNILLECGDLPLKMGGSATEYFYDNHLALGVPDHFDIHEWICEGPPAPAPRSWLVSFALADDGETLTASPVEIEETERTDERAP